MILLDNIVLDQLTCATYELHIIVTVTKSVSWRHLVKFNILGLDSISNLTLKRNHLILNHTVDLTTELFHGLEASCYSIFT